MTLALITGATSGIGAAFAGRLAADGHDLVLVARDADRLSAAADQLTTTYGADVRCLSADLATAEGTDAVAGLAATADLVVNNAGFGVAGRFLDTPLTHETDMLRVHCEAILKISHAALPGMIERGSGGIINVASVSAFLTRGTYGASKAWIVSFTRALAHEHRDSGVRFTASCPGFVHTRLHQRAGMNTSAIPAFMWLSADLVVGTALADLRRGRPVSIPGAQYKAIVAASKVLPRTLLDQLSSRTGRRPAHSAGAA